MSTSSSLPDPIDKQFHKNEEADIAIYNQRILNVLDKAISRVHIVSMVSDMAADSNSEIFRYIQPELVRKINWSKKKYDPIHTSVSEHEYDEYWSEKERKTVVDNDLVKIIVSMENNDELQAAPETNPYSLSPALQSFVRCLKSLRDGVDLQQGENAAQERAKGRHLKKCYQRNEKAKREIEALEAELASKKSEINTNIMGKNLMISRHQNKIDHILKLSKEAIDKRISSAEYTIKTDIETSILEKETLTADVTALAAKYEKLLHEHLRNEKMLRNQRTKVENQLVAFMQKFDNDMTEKQKEEELLLAQLEEEKRKYEAVQKLLDEQEEEYEELMQEKAAYEQELLEQKLFIFILNRSARRIQRAFRAYQLKKMMSKKNKRGKKGGKEKKKKGKKVKPGKPKGVKKTKKTKK